MGRRNIDVSDPAPDARGGAGLDRRRLKAAARQYSLEVEYRTIHAAKGGEADYAVLIDSGVPRSATARPARARPRHRGRNGRTPRRRTPALVRGADARPLRGADRGVRSRWRHLAGDQGDHRKRGPAAHGRREPAQGVARAGAGSGAMPVLQPRRCRHRAPAGDYWPAPAFRGLHELERRRGLRLHAALLQRLRHRHAGGGPRRALRVLRPVLPVEAARLLLPAPETYGCTASEAHGEAFLGLLAVRRGRRLRPHAAHRLNPGHLR